MSMGRYFELILSFLVLLISLREALGWRWTDLIRSTREDTDFDAMNNDSNGTTTTTFSPTTDGETTTMAPPTPILTADAIANIVLSAAAVIFITAILCYLMITFNQVEHRTRVRTALQRNKQIDRQISAARVRQQQQQLKLKEQEELIGEEGLKVETVGGAEDGRRLPVPAAVGVVNDGDAPSNNGRQGTMDRSKMGSIESGTKAEETIDFEDTKRSGTSSMTVDDDNKPLISIGEGDSPPNQQPVLLVQPAQPELV